LEQVISRGSANVYPVLLGELELLKGLVWVKIMTGQTTHATPNGIIENERYLTVKEVAARFNVTVRWVYRHKKQMPHSQPSRKILLFPERAIVKWFASRISV